MKNQLSVTVYTRRNCHLCDEAAEVLAAFQSRYDLALEYRDVDSNPSWRQNFGQEVPVAFLGEKKLFRYRIQVLELAAELEAYIAAQTPRA